MIASEHQAEILRLTGASSIERVKKIQDLWSGYGSISRLFLLGGSMHSVILKHIVPPIHLNHPRGWNTNRSNQRKLTSYEIEAHWYKQFSAHCDESCRVPKLLGSWEEGNEKFILLEDLNDAGYPLRKSNLSLEQITACLSWLANFHATFLHVKPEGLWKNGTYWHLETRPDEWKKMAQSELKERADVIDETLNSASFQTFVHGDAKVANFCFSEETTSVAAVDFQYVGGGCGMKDVAYFLGSVLGEDELEFLEEEVLQSYFRSLREAVKRRPIDIDIHALEAEWRRLYPIAWADFTRFLLGWMPSHQKLNRYSEKKVEMALKLL